MRFTQEHHLFRESARRFVDEEINPHVDEWELEEIFPAHDLFKKLGELGFLGLTYPEAYGGMGLDYWFSVIFAEELGKADCNGVPLAIAVQTDMCTPALAEYGSHDLKKRFLEPAIRGDAVGAIAVSEPDAGSDVAAIRTRAECEGDNWVITGRKLYITNGTQADWFCTLVRTSPEQGYGGMSLVVVPKDAPGFGVSRKLRKLGNRSSDTAELFFDRCIVPRAYTIGEEGRGFYLQMQQFGRERLFASVMAYSMCEKAVRMTIEYLRERVAFGKPLLENQAVRFRLSELLTEIEHLRRMTYHGAETMIAGEDVSRLSAMAKLKAGRLAREVMDTCLQYFGGIGYMEESPISRMYRDARLISIGGGADEVMLGIIARLEGL
ncbi:MAG: acyl-CoA dehydrogenase family protein [Vulcanimicrobiaceae bacterium]